MELIQFLFFLRCLVDEVVVVVVDEGGRKLAVDVGATLFGA
jgi:hypothetical protein